MVGKGRIGHYTCVWELVVGLSEGESEQRDFCLEIAERRAGSQEGFGADQVKAGGG